MKDHLPAVLDTGTSCLILPSNDHGGKLRDAPFKLFVDNFVSAEASQGESLGSAARSHSVNGEGNFDEALLGGTNVYLEIGETQYTLPYHSLREFPTALLCLICAAWISWLMEGTPQCALALPRMPSLT